MGERATVTIEVDVFDHEQLREHALKRALTIDGFTKEDFERYEAEAGSKIEYWLEWAFDAGTPDGVGFEIENCNANMEREV